LTLDEDGLLSETNEELFRRTKKLLEKEGKQGWKLAQETMLKEETKIKELQEAISYIMRVSPADYFRPALLSFCSRAVEGTSEVTVPTAASLVLFARAIGIHDDIIDQSKTKDNRTTVLGKFGRDTALILTDVLLFKGFTLLRKNLEMSVPKEKIVAILEVIDRVWFEQSEGGVLEVQARGKSSISPQECLTKIELIASEMEAIARIGGILGGGSEKEVETLGKYGRLLCTASILRNELIDVLDLKTLKHRMRKESLPLPLIYALQKSEAKQELVQLIASRRPTTAVLQEISKIAENAGGIKYVADLITDKVYQAYELIGLFKDRKAYPPLKLFITALLIQPKELKPQSEDTN
jgi:geranylgeranyl pyrophosphate synthase